jgi:hypothetical protein
VGHGPARRAGRGRGELEHQTGGEIASGRRGAVERARGTENQGAFRRRSVGAAEAFEHKRRGMCPAGIGRARRHRRRSDEQGSQVPSKARQSAPLALAP